METPPKAHPLVAVYDRLARAEEHFKTVKTMVRAYFHSDAYRIGGEFDGHKRTVSIDLTSAPDIRLTTVVGELVHDLRSALDHLAWQLVRANGGVPTEKTYFPILKSPPPADLQGQPQYPRVVGGVSAQASALILRSQPYALTGDGIEESHSLWLLHRMSIIDKHRHISIKGVALDNFNFHGPVPGVRFRWHGETTDADEYSAEIRIVPDDPTVDVNITARMYVIIAEPPKRPSSLVIALEQAISHVRDIIGDAERTCFP